MSNPFIAIEAADAANSADTLPELIEYAWDFDHDCFIFENGRQKVVYENEALKVWIYKTLRTERSRYRAYPDEYACELEQYVGKRANNAATAAEIETAVLDALVINPYIRSVDSITVTERAADRLEFKIILTSVYGQMAQEVTI